MSGELAVQNILVNDSAFKAITTSVFYDEALQTTPLPFVILGCDSVLPHDNKSGVSTLDFDTIFVTCFAADKLTCNNMATAARNALDRKAGTFNGVIVESIQFQTQRSGSEYLVDKKTFTMEQTYQVMTQR